MAFAYLTLLNNFDLWTLRGKMVTDPTHACHRQKGGIFTRESAGGGGDRKGYKSGFDREGTKAHLALLSFSLQDDAARDV